MLNTCRHAKSGRAPKAEEWSRLEADLSAAGFTLLRMDQSEAPGLDHSLQGIQQRFRVGLLDSPCSIRRFDGRVPATFRNQQQDPA